jgi:integrase
LQVRFSLDGEWRRLAERAGVRLVRFHDLRHTTATVMLGQGIDVRTWPMFSGTPT